ncbi:MAG: T9SS type A sorting domain-containing protein [Chitinophagales bacterium]|nr:T9SS type A sorting domain-containing protein [Chitinophagales bacterium]
MDIYEDATSLKAEYDDIDGRDMFMQPDGKLVVLGKTDGLSLNDDFWIGRIITNDAPVAIDEYDKTSSVSLFPNPAKEYITIESNSVIQSIEIISVDGKLIEQKQINNSSCGFGIDNYPAGFYILRLTDMAGNISEEYFVKE